MTSELRLYGPSAAFVARGFFLCRLSSGGGAVPARCRVWVVGCRRWGQQPWELFRNGKISSLGGANLQIRAPA